MDKLTLGIDATILNSIQSCPKRTELTHIRNLQPIEERRAPLEAGRLFHAMMEIFNRYSFSHPHLCAHEVLHYIKGDLSLSLLEKEEIDMLPADYYFVRDVFEEYASEDQNFNIHSIPEETIARVMYDDDDLRIIYAGKIDLRINTPDGGSGIPLDYKTEGRKSFPDKKSNQFIGYCWLTESNEICIQKIGFQGAPWAQKDGMQRNSKSRENYQRTLTYTDEVIEDWIENTIYTCRQWVTNMHTGFFPQNRTACNQYGKPCSFWRVCEDKRENEQEVLSIYYQAKEPWDIFKAKR